MASRKGNVVAPSSSSGSVAQKATGVTTNDDVTDKYWRIPELRKDSYQLWKFRVDSALTFKGVSEFVRVRPDLNKLKDEQQREGYFLAWRIVAGSLSTECAHLILKVSDCNPFDAYKAIVEEFEPPSTSSHLQQRRAFYRMRCHATDDVSKFISEIDVAAGKLQQMVLNQTAKYFTKATGKEHTVTTLEPVIVGLLKELMEVEKLTVLLGGLPADFDVITTLVENDKQASYETATKMVVSHANKLMTGIEPVESLKAADVQTAKNKSQRRLTCYKCHRPGHKVADCRQRSGGKNWDYRQQKKNSEDNSFFMVNEGQAIVGNTTYREYAHPTHV
jgi:hypothetical protein